MPFTPAMTDADAYRAQVGHLQECLERAYSADIVHGVDGNGRARKLQGVGWPPAELHQPARLYSPNTVTATGAATNDDIERLVNYMLAGVRTLVRSLESHSITHSVTLSNIVRGASAQATISAISTEVTAVVTAWNMSTSQVTMFGAAGTNDLPNHPQL